MIFNTNIRVEGLNKLLKMHIWARTAYKNYCYYCVRDYVKPRTPKEEKRKVIYTHIYTRRPFDEDNLRGGLKYVTDALKHFGLIYDDAPKWLSMEINQKKGKQYGLIIEVLPV